MAIRRIELDVRSCAGARKIAPNKTRAVRNPTRGKNARDSYLMYAQSCMGPSSFPGGCEFAEMQCTTAGFVVAEPRGFCKFVDSGGMIQILPDIPRGQCEGVLNGTFEIDPNVQNCLARDCDTCVLTVCNGTCLPILENSVLQVTTVSGIHVASAIHPCKELTLTLTGGQFTFCGVDLPVAPGDTFNEGQQYTLEVGCDCIWRDKCGLNAYPQQPVITPGDFVIAISDTMGCYIVPTAECPPTLSQPTGCCTTATGAAVTTEDLCDAIGGVYSGDGVPCP